MTSYRRGFIQQAEALSEEIREELGLGNLTALDALGLAKHLSIPVVALTKLRERAASSPELEQAVDFLLAREQATLSAVTVFAGPARLIVHNDAHEHERQVSDLTHELAHGLLLHPPAPAFDERGCRAWDDNIENEAAYLGGALLIPGKGARWLAKSGYSTNGAAQRFRVSSQMVTWRLNTTGARRLMKN